MSPSEFAEFVRLCSRNPGMSIPHCNVHTWFPICNLSSHARSSGWKNSAFWTSSSVFNYLFRCRDCRISFYKSCYFRSSIELFIHQLISLSVDSFGVLPSMKTTILFFGVPYFSHTGSLSQIFWLSAVMLFICLFFRFKFMMNTSFRGVESMHQWFQWAVFVKFVFKIEHCLCIFSNLLLTGFFQVLLFFSCMIV